MIQCVQEVASPFSPFHFALAYVRTRYVLDLAEMPINLPFLLFSLSLSLSLSAIQSCNTVQPAQQHRQATFDSLSVSIISWAAQRKGEHSFQTPPPPPPQKKNNSYCTQSQTGTCSPIPDGYILPPSLPPSPNCIILLSDQSQALGFPLNLKNSITRLAAELLAPVPAPPPPPLPPAPPAPRG